MDYLLVVLLWASYCALHSFLISVGFTGLMARRLRGAYAFYRLFYVVVSFALLIPLIRFTAAVESPVVMTYDGALGIARYGLSGGALLLFLWAFLFDYDPLSFFGIRQMLNARASDTPGGPAALSRKGLLGIVRHPMYFAVIVYLWCQTVRLMDVVVNALLTLYVLIGTWLEERKLVLEFGEEYRRYQREVPMLVPFAPRRRP